MISLLLLYFCFGFPMVSALCPIRSDLVSGSNPFAVTSSTASKPRRVLKGTKNTVKGKHGKDLDFAITTRKMGGDFNVSRLCLWTLHTDKIHLLYQGPHPQPHTEKDGIGRLQMWGTGPELFREVVKVSTPWIWTKSCIKDKGLLSMIQLQLPLAKAPPKHSSKIDMISRHWKHWKKKPKKRLRSLQKQKANRIKSEISRVKVKAMHMFSCVKHRKVVPLHMYTGG